MSLKIHVTVWNEFLHEKEDERVQQIYPNGMHHVIAEFLSKHEDIKARTATLDQPEHGISEEILNQTDVLIWWVISFTMFLKGATFFLWFQRGKWKEKIIG